MQRLNVHSAEQLFIWRHLNNVALAVTPVWEITLASNRLQFINSVNFKAHLTQAHQAQLHSCSAVG